MQCTTQDILYAALYLATKVEDNYIGINTFTSLTSTQPLTIRKLEVKLLEWLDFDLKRALPFLPLQGIVLRLQTAHDQKAIVEIYSRAEKCVTWVVAYNHLSELPPAKMAFAMMFYFAKKKGDVKIQRYSSWFFVSFISHLIVFEPAISPPHYRISTRSQIC